ncbi:hypothetical protein KPZU09_78320 [Klebsiella pneumoniae]|uniref:Uncharacterized protein n=1 Tax=Klebsiella pneumoniae TaxID=573 RepID=A0A919I8T8_KLEPN|nr:hypothetical protein KPZU09_78320 [Klebsiella pneumoniae]
MAHSLAEDLTDIGGRIGTDQKRSPARSASHTAVAQAREVFPTPPLPVKKINGGIFCKNGIVIVELLRD